MGKAEAVETLDKKGLRALADKVGVKWSKTEDTEETLRTKLGKALAKDEPTEKAGTAFDTARRMPTTKAINPRTKKVEVTPTGCFGWYYDAKHEICSGQCPHAKACSKLTEKSAEARKALEAEEDAEAEVEELSAEEVEKALKPAKKAKAKVEEDSDEDTLVKPGKRKGQLDEATVVEILYDREWCDSEEDDDLRKFYKKAHKAGTAGSITLGALLDVLSELYDVSNRAEALTETLVPMIDGERFKKAE